jgi:cell pole-organizing protein PopZ
MNSYPSVRSEEDALGAKAAAKPESVTASVNAPLPTAPFVSAVAATPKPLPALSGETQSLDDDLSDLVEPVASLVTEPEGVATETASDAASLLSRLGALSATPSNEGTAVPTLSSLVSNTAPTAGEVAPVNSMAEEATAGPVSLAQRLAAAVAVQAEKPLETMAVASLTDAVIASATPPQSTDLPETGPTTQVTAKAVLESEVTTAEVPAAGTEFPPQSATLNADVSVAEDPMETALGALAAGLAASRLAATVAIAVPEADATAVASKGTEAPVETSIVEAESPEAEPATIAQSAPLSEGVPDSTDDAMAELLRPMLRQWLDTNMPRIVERALRVELAKNLKPPK